MDSYPALGIVMATHMEAKPFINEIPLQPILTKPFRVYKNDRIILIVTGIGKKAAEMGTRELIQRYTITTAVNLGAAGWITDTTEPGGVYAIDRVTDLEPVAPGTASRYETADILDGFPTARLITADRPLMDKNDRDMVRHRGELVDMEGASFLRVCRQHGVRAYIIKFVSDTPAHRTPNEILLNIRMLRNAFYRTASEKILPLLLKGNN